MRVSRILPFLLWPGAVATAQLAPTPLPRLGVVVGVNSASVTDADGLSSRTSYVGGLSMTWPLSGQVSFQPELLFTMKGAQETSSSGTGTLKLNYLEVPLLLRFDIPATGNVKPFVYAGPSVAVQTSCNIEGSSGGSTVSFSCEELAREAGASTTFSRTDAGAIFGGGIAFDVNGRTLTVGARYESDFVKISSDSDSKNRVLTFIATIEWPFHRGAVPAPQ